MTEPIANEPVETESAPAAQDVNAQPAILPLVRLLPPPPAGIILTPPEPAEPPRRAWFFGQLWAEFKLALRMYLDPRYRVSRTAQLTFPAVAVLLVLNYFVFSLWVAIPFFSPIAERLLVVVLVLLAYRVLTRELDRYRTVLEYLAQYGQRT